MTPAVAGASGPAPAAADAARRQGQLGVLVRGTALGLVQQALAMSLGIVLLPLMLRTLGTERVGALLTVQLLSMGGLIGYTDLGFSGAIVRYLSGYHATGDLPAFRKLLTSGLVAFAAAGTVGALLVALFAEVAFFAAFDIPAAHRADVRLALHVYAASLVFQFPSLILKAFYLSVHDVAGMRVWEIVERLLYAAAVVAVLLTTARLLHVVLVEQAVALALLAAAWLAARRRHGALFAPRPGEFSGDALRAVAGMSGHVFGARMSQLVTQKAPEIIIASVLGAQAVAHFAIVSRLPRALKALQSTANAAVLPLASSLDARGEQDRLVSLTLRSSRYAYLCLTPVAVFLAVHAEDVLRLWAGASYAFLANGLRLFLAWQFAMLLVFQLSAAFTRTAQMRDMNLVYAAGNVVFLLAALAAVRAQGLRGVLLALVLSAAVTTIGVVLVQRRALGVGLGTIFRTVVAWPILGAGATALLALLATGRVVPGRSALALAAVFALSAVIYWAVIARLALAATERRQIVELARRIRRR